MQECGRLGGEVSSQEEVRKSGEHAGGTEVGGEPLEL